MGKKTLKPQYQHSVTIYDVDDKAWYRNSSNTSNLAVPVCRKERLNWLGYTNKGHLVTMDSGCKYCKQVFEILLF
uniref:DUF4379 domain-containing protein n=1 Tax=Heterorhabditis bacteriophora TaxID=37862 RepID=A0A1I7XLT1_HETBA